MTTSISLLRVLFKAVLDAEPWRADPLALHMPWREEAYQLVEHGGEGGKLCFALMKTNGLVMPVPPVLRALEMTRKALEAQGHTGSSLLVLPHLLDTHPLLRTVLEWELPDQAKMAQLLDGIYTADGGKDIDTECARSGEPRLWGLFDEGAPPALSTYEYWQLWSVSSSSRF